MEIEYNPKVSVVVSMYNASSTIQETLESIFLQSFQDFEVLVIDDCSTDNSLEIVRELSGKKPKLKFFKTTTNSGGPAEPRNIGIREAKGEYIAFVDSDDLWLPQKLEIQLKYLQNYSLVCTDIYMLINNKLKYSFLNRIIRKRIFKMPFYGLLFSNQICLSSVICRSDILKNILFNEDVKMQSVEDYYMWLQIGVLKKESIFFIDEPLVKYRIHLNNLTSNKYLQYTKSNYCQNYFILENKIFSDNKLFFLGIFYKTIKILIHKSF